MADLPFGLGFHPYLGVGTTTVDQARLRVPARRRLLADERGLPTGSAAVAGTEFDLQKGRPIGVTRLDTAYLDLVRDADGRVRVDIDHPDGTAGSTLWADERFGYLMIFTGDTLEPSARRTAVAVEPMTCPPDAFRTGTDVTVLRPGARWTGVWGVSPADPAAHSAPDQSRAPEPRLGPIAHRRGGKRLAWRIHGSSRPGTGRDVDRIRRRAVRPLGFEPRTCGLRVRCSAVELEARGTAIYGSSPGGTGEKHVSGGLQGGRRGSNPRPPGSQPGALTS